MSGPNERDVTSFWNDVEGKSLKLKILMAGKTGVGKTSIVNRLVGAEVGLVAPDGKPCTKSNEEVIWTSDMGNVSVTDVPGFGEAGAPTLDGVDYQDNIRALAKNAHITLLVLKCDDKALEIEETFLKTWNADDHLKKVPLLVVVNQIEKMKPLRDWNPESLNLRSPTTPKELSIHSYLRYIAEIPAFAEYDYSKKIFPASAGEAPDEPTYGIDALRTGVTKCVPDALGLILFRNRLAKEEKAKAVISGYAVSAGAAAIQPIPLVDSFIIAPIQIAMILHLGKIYGVAITKSAAGGILSSLGLSLAGNMLFLNLVSFVPGFKQVLGPAIAYGLTYTSGLIVKELFETGNLTPSKADLEALANKYKDEVRAAKEQFEATRA